jgi:hypothetical protein
MKHFGQDLVGKVPGFGVEVAAINGQGPML